MVTQDRLLRGFVAGLLAGVVMMFFDQGSVLIGISHLSYAEWASVFTFGHLPGRILEHVIGQAGHLIFCGFVGLIFFWLIPVESHLSLKGILWGLFIWMSSYWISILFKIDPLYPRTLGTVATDFITACIYGWMLAKSYVWLELKKVPRS